MVSIVRVSRGGDSVILKDAGLYAKVSADLRTTEAAEELSVLLASGSWRRPISADIETFGDAMLSVRGLKNSKPETNKKRKMRLPTSVSSALASLCDGGLVPPADRERATHLVEAGTATLDDISWLVRTIDRSKTAVQDVENSSAYTWASRTLEKNTLVASAFEPSDDLTYYAVGDTEESVQVQNLLAVPSDSADGLLLTWTGEKFIPLPSEIDDYEAPMVVEIDENTAQKLADWITAGSEGGSFDIADIDPEERNLAELAYSEIDWGHIDRLQGLVADASGYSPLERSENARRQVRGGDGKFSDDNRSGEPTKFVNKTKARIHGAKNIIVNPAARIEQYMAEAANAASADEATITAAGLPGGVDPLYMAVVDAVDRDAVLDIVAIVPSEEGHPSAWMRAGGSWTSAPEMLEDLQGITPPPVVELTDETEIKEVMSQIDQHDQGVSEEASITAAFFVEAPFWEFTDYTRETRHQDAKRGRALPDGSYPIHNVEDLKNAIQAYGRANEGKRAEVKKHIRKRARALGRTDLIPEAWSEASVGAASIHNTMWECSVSDKDSRERDARKGIALPDGSFPIYTAEDLKNAISAYNKAPEHKRSMVRSHIRKRARALNRVDFVPTSWAEAAITDMLEEVESQTNFYGIHGEVLVAAGVPGVADTPSDFQAVRRLKNYWLYGKGGAKINWANPAGNMTRCIRHLSKYMPGRAGGYCQELHKEFYGGATNAKIDKAAGV